jgi:amidase
LPAPQDNRLHAWAWKSSIRKIDASPLDDKRIAIKDNVAVTGLPLRNGSKLLEGLISSEDATVVSRILAAGGEIADKATCEDLCFSGGSHTSQPSFVLNPHNPGYMSDGSSSGCAALVAAGECDAAIGGDQGGSIRIPSSWCGIYGLKPTWSLVPYTGAFPIEPSLDHLGPMARTVDDLAALFDVIAGRDGLDACQFNTPLPILRVTLN